MTLRPRGCIHYTSKPSLTHCRINSGTDVKHTLWISIERFRNKYVMFILFVMMCTLTSCCQRMYRINTADISMQRRKFFFSQDRVHPYFLFSKMCLGALSTIQPFLLNPNWKWVDSTKKSQRKSRQAAQLNNKLIKLAMYTINFVVVAIFMLFFMLSLFCTIPCLGMWALSLLTYIVQERFHKDKI